MEKPVVVLTGENGNIFNIAGKVSRALRQAGLKEEAKRYQEEVFSSKSYDEALSIAFKYVEVE